MIKKWTAVLILLLSMFVTHASVYAEGKDIHNEVIYQLLIDRFNNGDSTIVGEIDIDDPYAYHGGDFQGIINKLDDLKDIGITTISLSPIMANKPGGYHGYWIEDYYAVNPQFGTLEDFKRLVEEAHRRDIKIIVDFVFTFVSDTNPIVEDEANRTWWYVEEEPGNDWSAETVQIDLTNPDAADYMKDAAKYWMTETGIDGFKLYAADEAPEGFIAELIEELKAADPEFYLIGDLTSDNPQDGMRFTENTELDLVNYPKLDKQISETFADVNNPVEEIYKEWSNSGQTDFYKQIDGFQEARFTNLFSENQRNALTTWTLALTYMYTTPGTTVITQGTEIPMYGGDAEESQRLVPFNSGDADLKEFHKRIASLHNEFPALSYGDFELVGTEASMSVFRRSYEGEVVYIAINNGSESAYIDVDDVGERMQLTGILQDNLVRENEAGNYRIGIPRESVEVYLLEEDKGINWLFIGFIISVLTIFVVAIFLLKGKQKQRERQKA